MLALTGSPANNEPLKISSVLFNLQFHLKVCEKCGFSIITQFICILKTK